MFGGHGGWYHGGGLDSRSAGLQYDAASGAGGPQMAADGQSVVARRRRRTYQLTGAAGPGYEDYGGMPGMPGMFGPWGGGFTPPPPPPCRVTCGELRRKDVGKIVELAGKVHKISRERFIQLKDAEGFTQLVIPIARTDLQKRFAKMPLYSYIAVVGVVQCRPTGGNNEKLNTGDIEVKLEDIIMVKINKDSGRTKLRLAPQGNSYHRIHSDDNPPKITSEEYHKFHGSGLLQKLKNRKYTCGDLSGMVDESVKLTCWVEKASRKFISLMDGYGKIQCVVPAGRDDVIVIAEQLIPQAVVLVSGKIAQRPESQVNTTSVNGHIELHIESLEWPMTDPQEALMEKDIKLEANSDEVSEVNKFTHRTHTCGELRSSHSGQRVVLCGWLQFQRISKFILLRDSYGITQCVISEQQASSVDVTQIPLESVVKVEGMVAVRPPNMVNEDLVTGEVEVVIMNFEILNKAENVPFKPTKTGEQPTEECRMKYRFIDLRSREMQNNLRLRSKILQNIRTFLIEKHSFLEVETPALLDKALGRSDAFKVQGGEDSYSLVQSPQIYNQLLMIGGVDRCFQISKCYKQVAVSYDTQPEFTQLSMEMSFTGGDSVLGLVEQLLYTTFPNAVSPPPFQRITHKDAYDCYGTHEPDLSYDLKFTNLTSAFENIKQYDNFGAYAIEYPKRGRLSGDACTEINKAKSQYKNVVMVIDSKKLSQNTQIAVKKIVDPFKNYILAYGDSNETLVCLSQIRKILAQELSLVTANAVTPVWVMEPPMCEGDRAGVSSSKYVFSAPHPDDVGLLDCNLTQKVQRAYAFTLVVNGVKIGWGSVRNIDPDMMKKQLEDIKMNDNISANFVQALKSGCPPHAGISIGVDRLVALACCSESIGEVIAFPKSHEGTDTLSALPMELQNDGEESEPSTKIRKMA